MPAEKAFSAAELLTGRHALIAGGTGSVGRVLVEGFLAAGATVIVPSRSAEKISALRSSLNHAPGDRLITIVGDIGDEGDAERVRDEVLAEIGPLDTVIATLGGFVAAPSVLAAPVRDLRQTLDGYLLAHFIVAKTLMPMLEERAGSYTFLNGPLAFDPLFPGTGLVSIATAGQAMFARVLMKELDSARARINELVIYTRFGWSGAEEPGSQPISQADVARYAVNLASQRGAGVRGETIHLKTHEPFRAFAGG